MFPGLQEASWTLRCLFGLVGPFRVWENVALTRPGKRLHNELENHWKITILNGKTHYFYGHVQ